MNPGDTIAPLQSITSASATDPTRSPTLSIFPSTITRSPFVSVLRDGSRRRPPVNTIDRDISALRPSQLLQAPAFHQQADRAQPFEQRRRWSPDSELRCAG